MICGLNAIKLEYFDDSDTLTEVSVDGGVIYNVSIPLNCRPHSIVQKNYQHIYIYHHITDRGMSLYGFGCRKDLSLFEDLLSVDKVGPSVACKLMSNYEPDKIRIDIADKDVKNFSKAKGVGKATVTKIIDKLSDKYSDFKTEGVKVSSSVMSDKNVLGQEVLKLAKQGLIKLGFKTTEVTHALKESSLVVESSDYYDNYGCIPSGDDLVSELIKKALKFLKR